MKYLVYNFSFIRHGLIRTHKWSAPTVSGFRTQLVRASQRYREVTGSDPVEVVNFLGFYTRNYINCVHNWEDHSFCEDYSSLDFTSAVQFMKYLIYNFSFIPHGLIRNHKCSAFNVSGFIAQLVRASQPFSEVANSNLVEVFIFSGFSTLIT